MGVLHQWRIETELSSLHETKLSKQTVNQFFFSFTVRLPYGQLLMEKNVCSENAFVAKMSLAKDTSSENTRHAVLHNLQKIKCYSV